MGCAYERHKLDFGDYSAKFPLPDGEWLDLSSAVCVERKMNLDELCACYCNGRPRFVREFERAKESGAKVYLLIENASWEMAYQGNYRSKMEAKALVASLCAWLARYNCQLIFCKQQISGELIHELLYREGKERLEAMVNG
jgi:ERCC4-type nuclease